MNKIVFIDIDGTIVDATRGMDNVSFKTRYAIEQLKANGDYAIIASGRNKGLLPEDVKSLNPSGFVLCNGSYAELDNKTIFSEKFDLEAVEKIKEITLKHHGCYILETEKDLCVNSMEDPAFKYFMSNWGVSLKDVIKNSDVEEDFQIAMVSFLDAESGLEATKELKEYVDVAAHNSSTSYDINIKGISKATGVKKIIEYLDLPFENTYCFGDGINDLQMLQSVYHPVLMANGHKELQKFNFEKTDDVLDDGFYNYLVSNKLIKAV